MVRQNSGPLSKGSLQSRSHIETSPPAPQTTLTPQLSIALSYMTGDAYEGGKTPLDPSGITNVRLGPSSTE
jgi:hypothetical protein